MSEETNVKQIYLQRVLEIYKNNPQDDNLSSAERVLLQQAFAKEQRVGQILKQMQDLKEELENKQKQLQVLDQQVVFERGQLTGTLDSLLALKPEEDE